MAAPLSAPSPRRRRCIGGGADFAQSKLSRASQTNQNTYNLQKTSRSAQAQSLYDCPSHIYRTPTVKTTEYFTEFPPQKKFCPLSREHSPDSSITDPFAVSLRQYSRERHIDSSAHLLRKLLIYTQARSSPKSINIRHLRTAIRKSQSVHKEKLLNKKPYKQSKDEKENMENSYRSNSCKNIDREISGKPSPFDNKSGANVPQKDSKVRHAKVGAGTKRPRPDLGTTYDYLQNSSCNLYLPRGILDRTTEVRYLDDVTRCVKDTIKMLCESEKTVPREPCPTIASRYMHHLLEYHHRDAQAQANFERGTTDQKMSKKNWTHPLIDFGEAPLCTASSPCRQDPKKCHFEPTCSFGSVCYFPDIKDNDEQLFPHGSIGGIVQEWMRGIPINANFTPTDKIIRDRIVVELTNNLSSIITEPNFEAEARKLIFNHLSNLPMWLPEGEAQIKFKNEIVDNLVSRLRAISYIIVELKSELFRWVKNINYEPRYDDGEIVTDCKIVNTMAERLEPLIVNRPENESVHKSNLHREILDELLNIPLDITDDFKCKVINNLADDLASRLVWLNAASNEPKKRSEILSIRNIINDWMENIPLNPCFSQIDLELREQLADELTNKLTNLKTNPNFEILGGNAIMEFLNNLPMWWPGDDNKDLFINDLTSKLINKLASPDFFVEVENIVSTWARNINTDNVDDIVYRVLDRILPIISNRQQLTDDEDYKIKLKEYICEELRKTPIDFKGESKSILIDELAEILSNKLIGIDTIESNVRRRRIDSKSEKGQSKTEYDVIQDIINNWVKTLPVNHDFCTKDKQIRDLMAGDLLNKLTQIENDANIEPKVKEASLKFLKSIPIWTPDDNEKDKFMMDLCNKLYDKILPFYSTEDKLKRMTSKWAEQINHSPTDEDGNIFDKTDITEKVMQKIRPVVLNRDDYDDDHYNDILKRAISEELRKCPFEVRPEDKNRVINELTVDLANNLLNLQNESITSQRIEPKPRSCVINDTVLKWLNDIPVKSDFTLEDDELRKELGKQLIDKLTKLTDDPIKLMEIPIEAEAKKAAIDCLRDLPVWRPGPNKVDEYNNELVNKLFKNINDTVGSTSQSRESKSDGNKRHSTSNTEAKLSNDKKSSMMREIRVSDAGDTKNINSKNEKRRKSSQYSDKGKSSNLSGNKRKSGDLKTENRLQSNASDSGRRQSSDSSGDRRKSADSKNEKRRKSNTSISGRKKTTESSGGRKSRDDKIKSGDSRIGKGRQPNSSDIDRGKSSESSGDRRKSRASDVDRNKTSDTKRSKSISNDSTKRNSSDSSEDRRKSAESKTEKRPKSNTSDNSRKKFIESSGDRESRDDKIKSGDPKIGKGRQPNSSDNDRGKSSESSGDKRKSRASDVGRNKTSDTKRSKSISNDSNKRNSSDTSEDIRKSAESKTEKRRKSNASDNSRKKFIESSGDRESRDDKIKSGVPKIGKGRQPNSSDIDRGKSSESSGDRRKSRTSDGSRNKSSDTKRSKSITNDTNKRKSSDSSGDRRKSAESKNEKRRKSNISDSSRKKITESSGNRRSRDDKIKSGDSRIGKGRQLNSSDIYREKSSESSGDRRKSRASNVGINKSRDTKRSKSISSDSNKRKSSDSSVDIRKSAKLKNEKRRKSNTSDIGRKKFIESSGDRKSLDDKTKSGDSKIEKGRQPNSSDIDRGKSNESSGDKRKSRASDGIRNKSSEIKRSKSISSDSNERKSSDSKKGDKRRRSRVPGENTVKLPKKESKSGEPFFDARPPKRPSKVDNAKRINRNPKSHLMVSSEPSVDGETQKKVFDIFKDNFVSNKLNGPPSSGSDGTKNFIDEAVGEWIDVLERKTMEKHFRNNITKCFKIVPEISKAIDKKVNQNLIHTLAIRLTNYEFSGYNKANEKKIKDEVESVVQNIFKNENIATKNQSVETISQAIMNVAKQVEKDKNNLKKTLETEITQWMSSIPEISKAVNNKEQKKDLKKLVFDIQMLAAIKTTDSVVMNRMQEKITLFLETVLQKERIIMDPKIKKNHSAKLLNHIILLIKHNKKYADSVNTLKSELLFWMVDVPLFKNAFCSSHDGYNNMKNFFHILLGLHRNQVNDRENLVKNVISEFITETIQKSCGNITAQTKSILTSELLQKLNIKEHNNQFKNELIFKLSGYDPGLSNKLDTLKLLVEEVIRNYIPLKSDFNKGWAKITKDDEFFYHLMTYKLAEILHNKFLIIYGSRQDERKDIPENLQSLIHKKGSLIDHSVVDDLTRELMADVSINTGTKRNQILKKKLINGSENLKQGNEDTLCKYIDSSIEKPNNISPSLKGGNNDNFKYLVTSEDQETPSKKLENLSNKAFLKGRHFEMKRMFNTSPPPLYKTYDNDLSDEKKSVDKEQEQSKKSIFAFWSHGSHLYDQKHQSTSKDFSNKPIISGRYSEAVDSMGKKCNMNSHPPSTSQSSEDLSNNTYSLRKFILKERTKQIRFPNKKRGKSNSPIRNTPSSPESSDAKSPNSPVDEEHILSIIKTHLYQSAINDRGVFNVIPCMDCPGTSKTTTKVRSSDIGLFHTRINETNEQHSLLRNRSPFERKDENHTKKLRRKFEHFNDEPHSVSTIVDDISKTLPCSSSGTARKGITEILVRRVGLNYKEAGKFADLLIERTNNIYINDCEAINKPIDTIRKSLKHKIQEVLRSFHIDHMLEETEVSIVNLLTDQIILGEVNDNVRTSLLNILTKIDKNIAAKVTDSLLDQVNKIPFTVPPKPPNIKPMAQDKRNLRQQYLTALSVEDKSLLNFEDKSFTSEDKQKYLEVKKDIVDFVTERIPSPTASVTEIIDTATDDLLRIYMNSKENKETLKSDLESVVRREIKNFLVTVPIETDESKNDLINDIANKLHDVDSIIKSSSSGETTTSTLSRNLSLVWTHEQQETFLRETKCLLNDIIENNDVDVSQAKHLILELDDKLREVISNKKLSNTEKIEQVRKEFFQYFRNLPLLPGSNVTSDDLATQVIDKIPSIITKLASDTPNKNDFSKYIVDFIRTKTGDMTPRSLQQLQAQVDEVMIVTKNILEDSDMTPNEKSDIIKLGFFRLISEIPRQTSETAEQLASEMYDKIFGSSETIPTTPSLTSSNEEVMIIRNNETRYLNQLMNIIRNWTNQVPIIRDEIDDNNLKDDMARDLAKDITDRQKYIQLHTSAKTSDEDELEYLKYQVFRWLNRTLDVNDLSPFINDIQDLMEQIRHVPICSLVKPSDKLLEDEITKWVEQVPCKKVTTRGNKRQIKEVANKIQRHRGKPLADSKIDTDISQFIPKIFKEDETTLKALEMQLKTYLKNQGFLKGTNTKTYKTGAEDLYELVEDWCRDLPIYLGDSPEEQEKVKTIKQNINSKLINKIGELNMNPQILNDDFLYEDLLLDEVDKLLTKVPRNPELEKYLLALKRDLISRVKGARQKIRDEQAGHAYIQQLRDTIATSASMPEPLYADETISFEILRENLVGAFINLHYVTDNNEDEIKFKRKISDEIIRFCNDYLRRHPCNPIDPILLSRQLYRALQAIPIPKDESMRSEIEELKIKEVLFEWIKEIPLKEETGSELLQRNKTIAVLAKRLREIEKEKESNVSFDSEGSIREEITKWLRRNPLKVGYESELPKTIDKIVEKLKKPEHVLDFSISYAEDCSCPPKKPVIPPCTLSPEDRAHLKRIRDKYNSPCITGKSSLIIDSCSQTIEPQSRCPNLKAQDRFPICPSKQIPFPRPAMLTSASPFEMHQYPNVNVKNYVWESIDSKMSSTQTPRGPCQAKSPYCIQKQMSTQQPLPDSNSVSSQVCPEYEPVICPRSSAFKCSQGSQARPNKNIPCSTPKTNRFIHSQDSDEDSSSEDYKCSPCRPVINSGVCRICRPSGALYSSFLPRKNKKKRMKKKSSDEAEFHNRFECCGKHEPTSPCSCKERNSKKREKFICYRASKTAEDESWGHSEAECPHPSYMYFR